MSPPNQDKNIFRKYIPSGRLNQFLPENKTIKWLSFILFLSRELNKELGDHRNPEVIQPRLSKYE